MNKLFSIDVMGFNATERIVLSSIFNLSARRSPSFTLYRAAAGVRPDIYLVDASSEQFIVQLGVANIDRAVPAVLVGDNDHRTGWPVLERPLQWARLFRAFDETIIQPGDEQADALPWDAQTGPHSPPFLNAAGISACSVSTPNARPGGPYRGEWVLVVDDSATIRHFMLSTLTALGLNVDVAESGEQAIGLTATKPYVCVFLDLMLPGVDGYQVCRLIKSKRALQRSTVIMLTSKGSPIDRLRGSMAGCDSYLVKPVDQPTLRRAVDSVLAKEARSASGSRTSSPHTSSISRSG